MNNEQKKKEINLSHLDIYIDDYIINIDNFYHVYEL